MKQINIDYTFNAPLHQVWQALTDQELIEKWGAGPAKFDPIEGGAFSLWDGDIHGTNTKVVHDSLLEQEWYGHDHPERAYKVTFSLEPNNEGTALHLNHADVPDEEAKEMEKGWIDYYFDPIKDLLEANA